MLEAGSFLNGKYKIIKEIGHGGLSVIYLAMDEETQRPLAVKEVLGSRVTDFTAIRRNLNRTTAILKKQKSPHLPEILETIDGEERFLIIMEYIEGNTLLEKVISEGAQPESQVLEWGLQLCEVLGYLHRQDPSVIYRDLKPANIMQKADGTLVLIDFDAMREYQDRPMTEDENCLGTRGYAAPEQFGGRGQTGPETDIYCLGTTLYHLLTGYNPAQPPYTIQPLGSMLPEYAGSRMEQILLKCTSFSPVDRYRDCRELAEALREELPEISQEQPLRNSGGQPVRGIKRILRYIYFLFKI